MNLYYNGNGKVLEMD